MRKLILATVISLVSFASYAGDINTTHGAILVVSKDPATVTAKSVHGPVIIAPTTEEVMKLYTLWYERTNTLLDRYTKCGKKSPTKGEDDR